LTCIAQITLTLSYRLKREVMMPLITGDIAKRPRKPDVKGLAVFLTAWIIGTCVTGSPNAQAAEKRAPRHLAPSSQHSNAKLDSSRRTRVGKASVYARKFAGKKMADGTKMNPGGDNAASKTLPLGSTAKVTNVQTGQSTKVTIRDRGPYVKDRILDVSPSTAQKIGIGEKQGVAEVKVDPLEVPTSNGSGRPGAAAEKRKSNKPATGSSGR
jgi:rare lipoprotein A